MVSAPITQALVREVEQKAAEKVSFGSDDPDQNYRYLMQMKLQLDNAHKNNQRQPKDLAILFKRLILTSDRTVSPMLMRLQF